MNINIPTPEELMERRKEKIRPKVESLIKHCIRKLEEEYKGVSLQIYHDENEDIVVDELLVAFREKGWHAEKHSDTTPNGMIILAPKSTSDSADTNKLAVQQDAATSACSRNIRSFG